LTADIGWSGHCLRPCVSSEHGKAIAHTTLELDLEAVVVGGTVGLVPGDGPLEELVWAARVDGRIAVGSYRCRASREAAVDGVGYGEVSVFDADIGDVESPLGQSRCTGR
jgi:hypothetical protein